MKPNLLLIAGVASAIAAPAWAQTSAPTTAALPAPSAASIQKASPAVMARMQALRELHAARVATYDRTEQAFRAPTEAERAALAGPAAAPSSQAATAVALPGGGVALRGAAAEVSYLVAEMGADGSTVLRHADAQPQRRAFARPLQPPLAVSAARKPAAKATQEARHAE